jgi:ribonucleoside-triphosphate reductase
MALFDFGASEWEEFAVAKKDYWLKGNPQRAQSNNSLLFWSKPSKSEISKVFQLMVDSGGSEPGLINAAEAKRRAPWFVGVNPCGEILLGHKSVCNLTEVDVSKFVGDTSGLLDAVRIAARANYRQTCVSFKDGILSEEWNLNNQFLRLCGVGLTGLAMRPDLTSYDFRQLERVATASAYSMADELGLPRPKNVTTIKPSGTLSKVADCTEGGHKPLGRFIFNNVNFSSHDPLVERLKASNYRTMVNPLDPTGVLVTLPVRWDGVEFDRVNGMEVNLESAVDQLERYKMLQANYTQQNTSITVSYSVEEVPAIVEWLDHNWNSYVGVSFLYRTDPTKTAKDLGYPYLPQEVVTEQVYEEYVSMLLHLDINMSNTLEELRDEVCSTGACPIK